MRQNDADIEAEILGMDIMKYQSRLERILNEVTKLKEEELISDEVYKRILKVIEK